VDLSPDSSIWGARSPLSPDDSRLYVLGIDSDDVTVIDTETNTVAATIPVQSPLWGGLSPDGTRLYATSRETDSENDWQVAVIDTGRAPVNVR
jgi:YVTN family beta-propeller protein